MAIKNILKLAVFITLACAALHSDAQTVNALPFNYCLQGGVQSQTSGLASSNFLQGIVPSCTVTVYYTGTTNLATIYSNSSEGTLGNPFTANTVGFFTIFASNAYCYDITISGGISPNLYGAPVTIPNVCVSNGSSGGQTIATLNQTGLTGNLADTNLYVVPSGATGLYLVTCNIGATAAFGTSVESTVPACVVNWEDGYGGSTETQEIFPNSGSTSQAFAGSIPAYTTPLSIYVDGGTTITIDTTGYVAGTPSLTYDLKATITLVAVI